MIFKCVMAPIRTAALDMAKWVLDALRGLVVARRTVYSLVR